MKPKEAAIGVRDISGLTKAQALAALAHKIDTGKLTVKPCKLCKGWHVVRSR